MAAGQFSHAHAREAPGRGRSGGLSAPLTDAGRLRKRYVSSAIMSATTRLYEAVTCTSSHASAVAALDAQWVKEESTPFRGAALTAEEAVSAATRTDVVFQVLIDCSAGTDDGTAVVGFAWCVLCCIHRYRGKFII